MMAQASPHGSETAAFPLPALHDLHVHLSFMANGEEVAERAQADGSLLFSNTVTPNDYARACERFARHPNVHVVLGMHPWWASDESDSTTDCDAALGPLSEFDWQAAIEGARYIGEIGLDFGKKHVATREAQLEAFERIARICALQGGKLVSLHSVGAAGQVIDILERCGTLESCTCVFHWYSGPSDQLKRAIDAGCLFSVGPRMLATGKGREYVKAIPASRLLLETDDPPHAGEPFAYSELRSNLESAARGIAAIKGRDALETIAETAERILD